MLENNKDVLELVYKISDDLEYEVDKDNIVTILLKQDHKVQRFFRNLNSEFQSIKRLL